MHIHLPTTSADMGKSSILSRARAPIGVLSLLAVVLLVSQALVRPVISRELHGDRSVLEDEDTKEELETATALRRGALEVM
jgi:hypothetical protein